HHTGVWLGFARGGVARFVDGRISASYSSSDGLPAGGVRDLQQDPDGTLWVSTETGLGRVKEGRVAILSSTSGLPCDDVRWVRDDRAGALWIATACWLVRLGRADIDRWAAAVGSGDRSAKLVPNALFGGAEGFRAGGVVNYTWPAVVMPD